ncbi:hypothetical protein [Burkholderia lata]|uniref:hypothetical protein n=1 Tax=Burkholderia lata (strain ATCC 17760 / DSM 23089 / LMG 22485 / NCIMB 9086 / R18194 / 383) TaxID=482957 RepID=UPI001582A333|nr:hypothetical protein [Burkholderia lata]
MDASHPYGKEARVHRTFRSNIRDRRDGVWMEAEAARRCVGVQTEETGRSTHCRPGNGLRGIDSHAGGTDGARDTHPTDRRVVALQKGSGTRGNPASG